MTKYLLRRVVQLVVVSFIISVLAFLLVHLLPGDPAAVILGQSGVTASALAAVRAELGLNHPLPVRYYLWLDHLLHGNLGYSFAKNASVRSMLSSHLPVTAEIIVLALIIALVVAVPVGVVSAYRPGHAFDQVAATSSFVLLAIPSFVMALLLILVFAVHLRLLPASGWVPLTANPVQNLRSAFLPSLALAMPQIAVFARILRGDMITTLHEDYVSLARAKGLSTRRILFGHAFRPSSFSLVTVVGLQIGFLLGGTVIVETIYALPGMGQLLVNAVGDNDYPIVQGVVLIVAAAYVLLNLLVDVSYGFLDPRTRRVRS